MSQIVRASVTHFAVAPLVAALFCLTVSRDAQATPVFQVGDFTTYSQDSWGSLGAPGAATLQNYFDSVYLSGVDIGIVGAAGFSALFTSASAALDYLPADGSAGSLGTDLQDPVSTSAGVFGGLVLALQFNVDFGDAGFLAGLAGLRFGDLTLANFVTFPSLNGLTVRQALSAGNTCLGGGPCLIGIDDLGQLMLDLSHSFEDGTPTLFAQDHLQIAATPVPQPAPVPEPATLSLLGTGIATMAVRRRRRLTAR